MPDREKVIKGITHHKLGQCDMSGKICPYWKEEADCTRKMLGDALVLLKEPEIIRCKECIWWGAERLCENSDSPCFQNGCTHGNWYCADGERKEGVHE